MTLPVNITIEGRPADLSNLTPSVPVSGCPGWTRRAAKQGEHVVLVGYFLDGTLERLVALNRGNDKAVEIGWGDKPFAPHKSFVLDRMSGFEWSDEDDASPWPEDYGHTMSTGSSRCWYISPGWGRKTDGMNPWLAFGGGDWIKQQVARPVQLSDENGYPLVVTDPGSEAGRSFDPLWKNNLGYNSWDEQHFTVRGLADYYILTGDPVALDQFWRVFLSYRLNERRPYFSKLENNGYGGGGRPRTAGWLLAACAEAIRVLRRMAERDDGVTAWWSETWEIVRGAASVHLDNIADQLDGRGLLNQAQGDHLKSKDGTPLPCYSVFQHAILAYGAASLAKQTGWLRANALAHEALDLCCHHGFRDGAFLYDVPREEDEAIAAPTPAENVALSFIPYPMLMLNKQSAYPEAWSALVKMATDKGIWSDWWEATRRFGTWRPS